MCAAIKVRQRASQSAFTLTLVAYLICEVLITSHQKINKIAPKKKI